MTSIWDKNASNLRSMQLPRVREKLSGLVRRVSTRKLRPTATGHDGVPTVAPVLEVDMTQVQSLRLAEGWLEDTNAESPPSPKRRQGRRERRRDGDRESDPRETESAQRYSTTPIADLFSMSTDQLASTLETIVRKPVPVPAPHVMPDTWSVAPPPSTKAPGTGAAARRVKTTKRESIPDVSVAPDLQPVRISLRHSTLVDAIVTPADPSSTLSRRRTVMSWSNEIPAGPPASSTPEESSQRHSVRETSLLRSVGPNTTGLRVTGGGNGGWSGSSDGTKRFSMPPTQPPADLHVANRLPVPEIGTALPTPRNASMPTPTSAPAMTSSSLEVRRRSWQPTAPVPAPQGVAGPVPRRTPSTCPPSAAPTSSRLAWIRELENRSSSSGTPKPEPQRLGLKNSSGGSVAGKLAMFEQMKKQKQQPASYTISRSNSTTSSRVSSGAMTTDSALAAGASVIGDYPPSTARTSMDSTRSHRNSAVMAYYDDEFREKMEGVAGGLTKQLDKDADRDSASGLRRVTARLVEVARGKQAQKEDQSREMGATDLSAEIAKEEQCEETQVEEQQVVVQANGDVEPAKEEVHEALALPVPAEEPSAVKVDSSMPLDGDESEAQPAATVDDTSAARTELTRTDSEMEKPTTTNLPSPDLAPVETKQPLAMVEEVVDEQAQGKLEDVAREEAVKVPIVSEEQDFQGTQGCSSVVGKEEVGVVVDEVVQRRDGTVPGVDAER